MRGNSFNSWSLNSALPFKPSGLRQEIVGLIFLILFIRLYIQSYSLGRNTQTLPLLLRWVGPPGFWLAFSAVALVPEQVQCCELRNG